MSREEHPRIIPKGFHSVGKYDTKALDKSYARHEKKSARHQALKKATKKDYYKDTGTEGRQFK